MLHCGTPIVIHTMSESVHTLFLISDRTGITVEHMLHTLLTQFDKLECKRVVRPFLDTRKKLQETVAEINAAGKHDGTKPVVFSSIVDPDLRELLHSCHAVVFDLFEMFIDPLSSALGTPAKRRVGLSHGMHDVKAYDHRVDAVNFALNFDDGARFRGLDKADLILVGVSRSGKTPTCLYLAMQYAVMAANYPLTEDDFTKGVLPKELQEHRQRLFGITIAPERLHRIRQERRPGSEYASLGRCHSEVAAAEDMFRKYAIPQIDSTTVSIEELAIEIMQRVGVARHF